MSRGRALLVRGGWPGHRPVPMSDAMLPALVAAGFEVEVRDSLDAYADQALMADLDLIVQCWTMDEISDTQLAGLSDAVRAGTGFAGWHGGIIDSFRASVEYLQLVGAQFVAHPGGFVEHDIIVTAPDHPIMAGISDITLSAEQYWVLSDDYNDVLATTTLSASADTPWNRPVTCPAVWTRQWGSGRVFVCTVGHNLRDFEIPQIRTIIERGMVWASR